MMNTNGRVGAWLGGMTPRDSRGWKVTRALLAVGAIAAPAALGACGTKQIAEGPVYPDQLVQARVLDVHVVRDETEISFTNTTAAPLPAGRMWINRWHSRDFPGLAIGQTMTINLFDFKDQYGDSFKAGGFFATEIPDRVVQVQIEANGEIIGLIPIRWSRD